MNRHYFKVFSLAAFSFGIIVILTTFFADDYIEVTKKQETKMVKVNITEIKECLLPSGHYAYQLFTEAKDTFYVLPERYVDFEYSGIFKRLSTKHSSAIFYTVTANEKYRSVEQLNHQGKQYLGIKNTIQRVKKDEEEIRYEYVKGGLSIVVGFLMLVLMYFLSSKEFYNIKKLKSYAPVPIENVDFPLQMGDVRFSKVKDYYLVDKKELAELSGLLKITKKYIVKGFLNSTKIKVKNIEYVYLRTYSVYYEGGKSEYYAEFYVKDMKKNRLRQLFTNKEKETMMENGIEDYFKKSNKKVLVTLSSILQVDYKV